MGRPGTQAFDPHAQSYDHHLNARATHELTCRRAAAGSCVGASPPTWRQRKMPTTVEIPLEEAAGRENSGIVRHVKMRSTSPGIFLQVFDDNDRKLNS